MKKYKLINLTTKQETICDKVTILMFDYYVSDESPFLDCFVYDILDKTVWRVTNQHCLIAYFEQNCNNWKVVIATNNPYIDLPKVVNAINNLAKTASIKYSRNDDLDELVLGVSENSFIEGYDKSQETHPYSADDMIEFLDWIGNDYYIFEKWATNKKSPRELFQLWEEQRPQKIYIN